MRIVALLWTAALVFAQDPSIASKLDHVLDAYQKNRNFIGSALIAKDGKVLLEKGYGFANLEWNIPNTPDTKFRLGSITKQFTATSIMQLSEQGKLSVDDLACKYVDNCPAAWKTITIHQLLTHTSGIPSYTSREFMSSPQTVRSPLSPVDVLMLTRDKPLDFEPGSKWSYDNSGYIFLGVIIEKVSGEKYADYLKKHIFGPLDMQDTGYDDTKSILKNRAAGYQPGTGGLVNSDYIDMSLPYAAGSLYSTVHDLYRWDRALYTEKVLSKASKEKMFTPYKNNYGYGLMLQPIANHTQIGHGGGIFGFTTYIARFPKDDAFVVVLSNAVNANPQAVATALAATLLENTPMSLDDSAAAGPITSAERILYIDILRGMALFGILAANMRGFNAPDSVYGNIKILFHDRADLIAQGFIDIFIQGKFVTLFSFLFGLGFAVQMSRAEARGARFMSYYPRRLAALALFGLIHGILIWWGDILLTYALAGTILLLFRNRTQETVLRWAGGIFLLPVVVISGFYISYMLGLGRSAMQNKPPDMAKIQSTIAIYAHGTAAQMLRENWVIWKGELPSLLFALYAVFLFLLGLWVYRSGIVERLGEYRPLLKRVCAWSLPIGIALNALVVLLQMQPRQNHPTVRGYFANILLMPSAHILSLGYASGLAVLIQSDAWRRRLTPFAAVGRMALTDYLTQSIVCTLFFYHYITGWYGRVGPALDLIPTVVLYSAQLVFSNWWLARYRFGPMEWLWRGMTYGKFPALRKQESVADRRQDEVDQVPDLPNVRNHW